MKKDTLLGVFKSKGRLNKEANSKYRSPFQRDRDRICLLYTSDAADE